MNSTHAEFACQLASQTPPIGVPIAIYAVSTEQFSEWFEGEYDGRHWRAHDIPATPPQWYVRAWRRVDASFDSATLDCRNLGGPPSAEEPILLSADRGT